MPESLYGAHPKKLPVRFKFPSHLDLLRFQHAKVKESVLLIIFKSLISLCFITCLIRISLNLKNDQKNHDPREFGIAIFVQRHRFALSALKKNRNICTQVTFRTTF